MTAAPSSLLVVADRVEHRLRSVLGAERERWAALDGDLAAPFEALQTLVLEGGKRLRAAFCYWGFVAGGGDPSDPGVIDAGAAFELLHAFALFHDDVMDGSSTRRGHRTAHLRFGEVHDARGWLGESRRFGEGVAILVGDLAFVYADQMLGRPSPRAQRIWNELRVELNIGQYLDLLGTARGDRALDVAERIARYKSARYTVERPLRLGAALASAPEEPALEAALSAYGLPLGDAFQLRDDVLGVFGDETVTGKPVGDDLREGKPTPLLAIATERAGEADAATLALVGSPDLTADEVARIQRVLVDTGALAEVEARIERLVERATAALDAAPVPDEVAKALTELAHYVGWRQR